VIADAVVVVKVAVVVVVANVDFVVANVYVVVVVSIVDVHIFDVTNVVAYVDVVHINEVFVRAVLH